MESRTIVLTALRCALMCTLALGSALHARSSQLAKHPIVIAVHRQSCTEAVSLIHRDIGDNDAPTAFLAARMLDEGICVQRDPELAAHFFARAAELGQRAAVLDYAAKVGLGIGAEQDFARSGELCRAAGVDGQKQLSVAAVGYACTVASIAGRLLRERLPPGAFTPVMGAAVNVEFVPASGALHIISIPKVVQTDSLTGSYVRQPVIDANREIENIWREALQTVPAPTAARTETHVAALAIDVDMTLEQGRATLPKNAARFLPGDIHATTTRTP
jgi:hypothetical protein